MVPHFKKQTFLTQNLFLLDHLPVTRLAARIFPSLHTAGLESSDQLLSKLRKCCGRGYEKGTFSFLKMAIIVLKVLLFSKKISKNVYFEVIL